jgi:hypothetical protein
VPAAAQSPGGECQGFDCGEGGSAQPCGEQNCFCFSTTEGPQCAQNFNCDTAACSSSADCGQNEVCVVDSCCGSQGFCTPLCGVTQTQTQRLQEGPTGARR